MLSHDWPRGVYNFGSVDELLRNKPWFKKEVEENELGSEPCADLLFHLKPKYWFSAHLHTKFSALIPHSCDQESEEKITENRSTSFLALDKCLPKRRYLEVIEVPNDVDNSELELYYDLEWLTILHLTDHLMSSRKTITYLPNSKSLGERWVFTPTDEEKDFIFRKMNNDLKIPQNFERTARCYEYACSSGPRRWIQSPKAMPNSQTEKFCNRLGIKDPIGGFENVKSSSYENSPFSTPEKAEFSTFISSNESLQENSATSTSSENTDYIGVDDVNSSKNEHSFPNSANDFTNDSFTSADYFSFIDRSSLSNRPASTPDILKKRKYDFPSFKEQGIESSADTINVLPIEVDRTGNTSLIKRRNANIYQA